jgi:hypothetical protein
MAGYVAMGRVQGAQVRAVGWNGRSTDLPRPVAVPVDAAAHDRLDARTREPLDERWQRFRDQWAMTMFYLFDPESWR